VGLLGRARRVGARRVRAARQCGADDVAVTTSVSAGVSALASAIDFRARPKVVISDYEFPTIGQIWHAQQLRGAEVHVVHPDDLEEAIDERTPSSRSRRSATATVCGCRWRRSPPSRARAVR
jgi:Selenocysteine lyase